MNLRRFELKFGLAILILAMGLGITVSGTLPGMSIADVYDPVIEWKWSESWNDERIDVPQEYGHQETIPGDSTYWSVYLEGAELAKGKVEVTGDRKLNIVGDEWLFKYVTCVWPGLGYALAPDTTISFDMTGNPKSEWDESLDRYVAVADAYLLVYFVYDAPPGESFVPIGTIGYRLSEFPLADVPMPRIDRHIKVSSGHTERDLYADFADAFPDVSPDDCVLICKVILMTYGEVGATFDDIEITSGMEFPPKVAQDFGWEATMRTTGPYDKRNPRLFVAGDKVYYVWSGQDPDRKYRIWTASMNLDGTGWEESVRKTTSPTTTWTPWGMTSTGGNMFEPRLFVAGDKVYYVWTQDASCEFDFWIGAWRCDSQIWTASMNVDGTGWEENMRRETSGGIQNVELCVAGDKVHYVWVEMDPDTYDYQIWTASMNLDGTGWEATPRGERPACPQLLFIEGDRVYCIGVETTVNEVQLWTASMNLDGTGWEANMRRTIPRREGIWLKVPRLHVADGKIFCVWTEQDRSTKRYQIWTASMNLDGTGWEANMRRDTIELAPLDSVPELCAAGSRVYYVWLESDLEIDGELVECACHRRYVRQGFYQIWTAALDVGKEFMITFDDGPLPDMTDKIVDALKDFYVDGKPVRAGFFMVGVGCRYYEMDCAPFDQPPFFPPKGSAKEHPQIVRYVAEAEAGHLIGNHTQHHAWFLWPWLGVESVRQEIKEAEKEITAALAPIGKTPLKIFRPPYLVVTGNVRTGAAKEGYHQIILGEVVDINPFFPFYYSVEAVKKNALEILKNWKKDEPCVLIFHDNQSVTYNNIAEIIKYLQEQGFTLVHFDPSRLPKTPPSSSLQVTDVIQPSQVASRVVPIDSTTSEATFNLSWQGSDLDLVLYTPDGTKIDPTTALDDPDVNYVEGDTYEYYTVQNPAPGNWIMEIIAVDVPPEGEEYTTVVEMETNLTLSLLTDKNVYNLNEWVNLLANLMNNDIPVIGASVTAEIERPDGSVDNIILYDDGAHNDIEANDGNYANVYTNITISGNYDISALATGRINGEQFERSAFTSIEIKAPAIPGDLDNDGDVDRDDLNIILAARNTPASGPDDPRDLDGDGMITALDARKLVTLCTRPRCACE